MDPERFRRAKDLLLRALDMAPDQRSDWLDRACEGDTKLRGEVESLLAQQDQPARILEEGVLTTSAGRRLGDAIDTLAGRRVPERIGPYEIVGLLGEGGMGMVYHGQQPAPLEREVALKVIRHGMDSAKVLARFEYERRSLARMEHPHIPAVLDAGSDEQGRPYVVLPLIRGLPITHFCDEQRLDPHERLRLFLKVCRAVEHAHGRGVLHRDLKPSNILVREMEGVPTPAVIDFGIAKALDLETEADLTLEGQRVGTPAYMSPEQLRWDAGDVDVRSDVYALGIILYELLSGRHPLGDQVDEATRAISGGAEPPVFPAPSTAVESAADTDHLAERRRVSVHRLRRVLRGDLDTICLAATRGDRTRRYPSVAHLTDDIERYLDGRAVLARPDSVTYRLGKYVRRHAVGATVAAAAVVLVLATTIFLAIYADRVGRERDRAVAAEAEARRETEAAEAITGFLQGLFTELDPATGSAADATAREILAAGAERVRASLVDQPLVRARLYSEIGRVHHGIALHDEAIELLREGVAVLESATADQDPGAIALTRGRLESALANVLYDAGRHEEAELTNLSAVEAFRTAGADGRAELGEALSYLAVSLQGQGQLEEAVVLLDESIAISRELGGQDDVDAAWARSTRGYVRYKQGDLRAAVQDIETALEVQRRVFDGPHADVAGTLNNLAGMAFELQDFERSRQIAEEALSMYRELYDGDHPALARALQAVGRSATQQGEFDLAAQLVDEAHRMNVSLLGEDHRNTTRSLTAIARLQLARGENELALASIDSVLARRARVLGEDHPETEDARRVVGEFLVEIGRYAQAMPVLERATQETVARFGEDHHLAAMTRMRRARALLGLGHAEEARSDLERAELVLARVFGPDDGRSRQARLLLDRVLAASERR